MKLCFVLLVLPAVIYAGVPDGWTCRPLTMVNAADADCVSTSTFSDGVWTISSKKVGGGVDRMCIVSLTGDGIPKVKNFYAKAIFHPQGPITFAGLTYNMEDNQHGNYLLLRMKSPARANLEFGFLDDGFKNPAGTSFNEAIKSSDEIIIELLVRDGEETLTINGVEDVAASNYEPYYYVPGNIGIGLQNVKDWDLEVKGAEVCNPIQCTTPDGDVVEAGGTYKDGLLDCMCGAEGFSCACPAPVEACAAPWTDPDTCESKCIPAPQYCYSSGDPHYKTFAVHGNRYYDFHGVCTYQAASCGEFEVNFKNVDLLGRPPRYTQRIELVFQGETFMIGAGNLAAVGKDAESAVGVQVPYVKTYTNGDRVEIINNGQLEILLYNKGRDPSVRLRSTNYGTWIVAEVWLHGSCADITEGMCGPMVNNDPNQSGTHYQGYDENCPAPPKPYFPCDDIDGGEDMAMDICKAMKEAPFATCNEKVSLGDDDGGPLRNCMADVCNCYFDNSCACSIYDTYATECINNDVDLANWQEDVDYCPYDCPEGMTYSARGASPPATCLDKNPEDQTTVRGCFCPRNQYLQDGVCVSEDKCKCLHEGVFYNNGDTGIAKEGECKVCSCHEGGEMRCEDMACLSLVCEGNALEVHYPDVCCHECNEDWVTAANPQETLNKGQDVTLTCEVNTDGVLKKKITWWKDGKKITSGISKSKLLLTIKDADADDDGVYTCKAEKDGKEDTADFDVEVILPIECTHDDGTVFEAGSAYRPTETVECTCDDAGQYTCECLDDLVCEDPTPTAWFDDACVKTCVPEPGLCTATADPHYTTFDGSKYDFKGGCIYNFFSCGDIAIYADHDADMGSSVTKSVEIVFLADSFKLDGNAVTLNGDPVSVPLHKVYNDGTEITITNVGNYIFKIVQDGKDPLIELTWDKVSSYSLLAHGTCKGDSHGLCGSWNDDPADDMKGSDGEVKDTAEDFGTSWAQDDETDCPVPPKPTDICEDFGVDGSPAVTKVEKILSVGILSACAAVVDPADHIEMARQEYCMCFGDLDCICDILQEYGVECKAAGFDTDGWQTDNKHSDCPLNCPAGTTYNAKGPKPAPTCADPDGGRKKGPGCFCPQGQIIEDDVCITVDECQCEYAGVLYSAGEKYDIPAECKTCTCVGGGAEDKCKVQKCKGKCNKDEIEVRVEGECCPICQANWLTAVNPDAEGVLDDSLELTCKVEGVEVSKDEVTWIKFNPGEKDVTNVKKPYSVSDDGLTFTIKKMSEERVGNYKCVVTKDGKTSEGVFEVTLPVLHEEMISAVEESVEFEEGGELVLSVKKEGGTIKAIYWVCNGERVSKNDPGVSIKNTKTGNILTINPASADYEGSCTCIAEGFGTRDEAEIATSMESVVVHEDLIEAVEEEISFTPGNKVILQITKLDKDKIDELTWECNGVKITSASKGFSIKNGKTFSKLTINSASVDDAGSCTCFVTGDGVEDSAEITLTAEDETEVTVTVTPKKSKVSCKLNKKGCKVQCTVEKSNGKNVGKSVKICKLDAGDIVKSTCKKAKGRKGVFKITMGRKTPADAAGDYVCVVDGKEATNGEDTVSKAITVTVK